MSIRAGVFGFVVFVLSVVPLGSAWGQDGAGGDGSEGPLPAQQSALEQPGYELVWHDEFEGTGRPDPEDWRYERGFVRNRELQWYQEENAQLRDGHLVITARREKVSNPRYEADSDHWRRSREFAAYTSASIETRRRHAFQYGRLVVRAKVRTEPGLWPAIWTVGLDRGWPEGGEIDIMEYYEHSILGNFCWAGEDGRSEWDAVQQPMKWVYEQTYEEDWDEHFHVWRLDWTPETMKIYMDDVLINEFEVERATYDDGFNPFRQPHVVKLNLAIGGTRGGDPSETSFPAEYLVDYVRIYKAEEPVGEGGE